MLLRHLCSFVHDIRPLFHHSRSISTTPAVRARLRPPSSRLSRPPRQTEPIQKTFVPRVTDVEKTLRIVAECLATGRPHTAQIRVKNKLTAAIIHEHASEEGKFIYRKLAEEALELFLSSKYIDGVEMVMKVLDDLGNNFSALSLVIRAKIMACRYANGIISRNLFLGNLKGIFEQRKYILHSTPGDFHGIIHHLTDAPDALHVLEKVTALYTEAKAVHGEFHLDSISIAFLVQQYCLAGNYKRASTWLTKAKHLVNTEDPLRLLPYKTYLKFKLQALTNMEDPEDVYGPLLKRMIKDGAIPDTEFVNMLLEADLGSGRLTRFFAIYDKMRSDGFSTVFPDKKTFQLVFAAHTERYRRGVYPTATDTPDFLKEVPGNENPAAFTGPRQAFWDLIKSVDPRTPGRNALCAQSLGSALLYFVHAADYAAALIALRMVVRLDMGLQESQIKLVLDALVERCQRELLELPGTKKRVVSDDGRSIAWVDVFLKLQETTRRRVKREGMEGTAKRVVSIARRAIVVAELDIQKSAAAKSKDGIRNAESLKTKDESLTDADVVKPPNNSSPQVGVEDIDGTGNQSVEVEGQASQTLRQAKLGRMHERRVEIIDVLLSRALATECFLNGSQIPSEDGRAAIELAGEEMVPDLSAARHLIGLF